MSVLPNRAQIMAHANIRRGGSQDVSETFNRFFESWLTEQNNYLEELVRAAANNNRTPTPPEDHVQGALIPLIDRVTKHYEHYYRTKCMWVEHDVLAMLSPSWRSTLEDAFLWIGGWRPSMAFHLLYSKSGLQLEAGLAELLQGVEMGNLADLSPAQMSHVDGLQSRTVREEREITEKLAKHQETVADASMVELSHLATELIRANDKVDQNTDGGSSVESTLTSKEEGLMDILRRADELRLNTLKEVLSILTPIQAVHFLIAAAELHLRLHEWGKKRDVRHHEGHGN